MAYHHPWPHAYPGVNARPRDEITRLTVELPRDDAVLITAVSLNSAFLTTICQYALKQTAKEIRDKSITYAQQREFIKHVCERAYSEFAKEAGESNVTGRTTGVCNGTPQSSVATTGSGTEVKKGSRGRGGEGRKKRDGGEGAPSSSTGRAE